MHIDLSETNKYIREIPIPSVLAVTGFIDAYIASKNAKVLTEDIRRKGISISGG